MDGRDAAYAPNERMNLARFRILYGALSAVIVLAKPHFEHKVVCFSEDFWPTKGQCRHALTVRWLENDGSIDFGSREGLTEGEGPQTTATADGVLRENAWAANGNRIFAFPQGRNLTIPKAAAWLTLAQIKARAVKRSVALREAKNKSKNGSSLFRSPAKPAADSTKDLSQLFSWAICRAALFPLFSLA